MENKYAVKFLMGVAVGAALSGVVIKYAQTEEGRKKREKIQKMLEDFKGFMEPKLRDIGDISRLKYRKTAGMAVEEFGRIKKLSEEEIDNLESQTMDLWDKFTKK